MSAQPLEFGPGTVPRTYGAIVAALPKALVAEFTAEYDGAGPSPDRILEYWGRIADTLADPETAAALARAVAAPTGLSLASVLDEAER